MKGARFGKCRHCGQLAFHKCRRCGYWLCAHTLGAPCGKLRKVPGQVGRYDLVCSPRCRKTRKDIGQRRGVLGMSDQQLAQFHEELERGGY